MKSLVPFGNYLLDELVARGGMARVYRARLRGLGGFEKTLVVKQILPELSSDPQFVEMFVNEAKTLVQMSHPNIVPVYELGVVNGVYFLAMEYVEGATLASIIRDAPLSPALAAHVGAQVCDALHYAHSRFSLVHRDVTPRNILVDLGGHVRLVDFGIAAPVESSAEGELFGSLGYMSPEQLGGGAVDARSDLFSLGAVLFQALTGERALRQRAGPPKNEDTGARFGGAPPKTMAPDTAGTDFAELVNAMLSAEPSDRPGAAVNVAGRLRGILAAERPQGVGPELAARAREARQRASKPTPESPAKKERESPSQLVRTLATSRSLQELLDSNPPPKDATSPVPALAGPPPARPTSEGSADEPHTLAIRERTMPRSEVDVPSQQITGAQRTSAPGLMSPGRNRRWWGWAMAAALVGAVAVSVLAWPRVRSRATELSQTAVPNQEGPAPVRVEPTRVATSTPSPPLLPPTLPSSPTKQLPSEEKPSSTKPSSTKPLAKSSPPEPRTEPAGRPEDGDRSARASARLTITATPWAAATLNGKPLGETPVRSQEIAAGNHVLMLNCPPLGRQVRVPLKIASGGSARVVANLAIDPPEVQVRAR